ncbi:hypothetical protein CA85_26390 [Allorhodopirellula solitaria]|uniref:Uncharacterized protein n=1 Tax=Allorhodopirellula solitaria TaxID=2527987 RepID=A0A5C5XYI9_9BACT|nr:hypothetical protein CA85_26390 [Allorhodopirellula solitaria]
MYQLMVFATNLTNGYESGNGFHSCCFERSVADFFGDRSHAHAVATPCYAHLVSVWLFFPLEHIDELLESP